jgi:hypothetical protein
MLRVKHWLAVVAASLLITPFVLRGQVAAPPTVSPYGGIPTAAKPASAVPASQPATVVPASHPASAMPADAGCTAGPNLAQQTDEEALAKSAGCLSCHNGIEPMHESKNVRLGCVDCHGGNACATTKDAAHAHPRFPERWPSSANPPKTYALLNNENPEWVRFINPGDWRCVDKTCGTAGCHPQEASVNKKSQMGHSSMVPSTALYNNGGFPSKYAATGEVYGPDGKPQKIFSVPPPTPEERVARGILTALVPTPRFEVFPPANVFRVLEINNNATSQRGVGTDFRIDAGVINVHHTKLNDPTMCFLGTNDFPGDYRSSGCTSCHVVYANDRNPLSSASYAKYGNRGYYYGNDPTIPKNETGHPIQHRLTASVPTSQCMTCHFHQGSGAIGNYLGYMWWDYESDCEKIYPLVGKPAANGNIGYYEYYGPVVRGRKRDTNDVAEVVNPQIFGNKLADWHNAGWLYQAVYKRDRHGNLLDKDDKIIPEGTPDWHNKAIHLQDVHAEKGMHCIDCHFKQDNHGDGRVYGNIMDPIEITCKDCHGTVTQRATFITSNKSGGNDLKLSRTPLGNLRFYEENGQWYQRSGIEKGKVWPVVQIMDVITPGNPRYNEKAMYAKTMRKDGTTWGPLKDKKEECELAHRESKMMCYACHSAWNTQCSGCHLDARVNITAEDIHYEGEIAKVFASYNPDVLRNDGFMLGISGSVQGNKVSPCRAASSVILSARDGNRAIVNHQQPTISTPGYSGHAMTTNPPHTVRIKETKTCTECHISDKNDNNAIIAKVFGMGVRSVDFVGRYVYVAERGKGFEAHRVTCQEDFPEPVIGSDMHRVMNPASYAVHLQHKEIVDYKNMGIEKGKREPDCTDDPDGWVQRHISKDCRSLQRYGEWLLIADGPGGLRVYDIANVANKNLAQRIVESPISPLGQSLRVPSKAANYVAVPSTVTMDTCRSQLAENEEQRIHPLFGYCFVADGVEGLIVVNMHTLVDSNPSNNFLVRTATFNPDGLLKGAVYARVAGSYVYVLCDAGMVVVNVDDPRCPKVVSVLGSPALNKPRSMDVQFRYAFICDCEGLKIVDITYPEHPMLASMVRMSDARDVKVMRTYAYVAAGVDGLGIVDVECPTSPMGPVFYNANGCINDASGVITGATLASLYVYLADGKNGLRVINVATPFNGSDVKGFSPVPRPHLIATHPTHGCAIALSEGMIRDRFVDESGNQVGVFGRRGGRSMNKAELEAMYMRNGQIFMVSDTPTTKPINVGNAAPVAPPAKPPVTEAPAKPPVTEAPAKQPVIVAPPKLPVSEAPAKSPVIETPIIAPPPLEIIPAKPDRLPDTTPGGTELPPIGGTAPTPTPKPGSALPAPRGPTKQ